MAFSFSEAIRYLKEINIAHATVKFGSSLIDGEFDKEQ